MSEIKPLVSIVIPVYNGANYMREAIESALAQTYSNIEVLVINDGSDDNGKTEEIARSYGDRIRYYSKENGGVATALNLGIREMRGKYFSWLSHDDIYYPHKVEAEVQYILSIERDVVIYSDYDYIDCTSKIIGRSRTKGVEPERFREALLMEHQIHGCTALIPRYFIEKEGLFDESQRATQDYDLWFKMAAHYDFVYLPEVLIQTRLHTEQVTITRRPIVQKESEKLYAGMLESFGVPGRIEGSPSDFYLRAAISLSRKGVPRTSRAAFRLFLKVAEPSERKAGEARYYAIERASCNNAMNSVIGCDSGRLSIICGLLKISGTHPIALKARFFWGTFIRALFFSDSSWHSWMGNRR